MNHIICSLLIYCAIVIFAPRLAVAITIPTVPVGNAGNAPDANTGFGGVSYEYRIGTTEVTVGQYTAFLNAVAADDTWGLYNTWMGPSSLDPTGFIAQSGSPGSYTYNVISSADRPVTYVNWGDAARFANWLHNGQPTGLQVASTTEDGAYTLNGANFPAALNAVTRNADAKWFLPSESEWYKAAYHKNDGPTGNYWDYPTASDTAPIAEPPPGGTNSANYDHALAPSFWDVGITDVGGYIDSASPYGTFDQAGNVAEWTEGIESPASNGVFWRGLRGGAWSTTSDILLASAGIFVDDPTLAGQDVGFRVATVPEPNTAVLAIMASAILWWWRLRFGKPSFVSYGRFLEILRCTSQARSYSSPFTGLRE